MIVILGLPVTSISLPTMGKVLASLKVLCLLPTFCMFWGKEQKIEDYGDDFGSNTLDWNGEEPSQGKARAVKDMMRMEQQRRKTKRSNKIKSPETHHTGHIWIYFTGLCPLASVANVDLCHGKRHDSLVTARSSAFIKAKIPFWLCLNILWKWKQRTVCVVLI